MWKTKGKLVPIDLYRQKIRAGGSSAEVKDSFPARADEKAANAGGVRKGFALIVGTIG